MAAKLTDLKGQRFGRWYVVYREGSTVNKIPLWYCVCDCGNAKTVRATSLRNGTSTSCGCYAKELSSDRNSIHGDSYNRAPEYGTWSGMKSRCYNTTGRDYHNYGGRGITVCDRWKDSYANFLADMGRRPSKEYSLERKDNNGNYEPGNCVWATAKEQMNNRRPSTEWNYESPIRAQILADL